MGTTPRKSAAAKKAPQRTKPKVTKAGIAQQADQVAGSIPAPRSIDAWQRWKDDAASIDDLCDYIISGGHMADFCRERQFKYTALRHWIESDTARSAMYARAREDRSDKLADEIVAISDEQEVQAKYQGEEVTLSLDAAAIQRNRLRIDSRKWIAAKLKPRTYGDKLDVTQSLTVRDMSDDELMRRAAGLLELLRSQSGRTA